MRSKLKKIGFAIKAFFIIFTALMLLFFAVSITVENKKIENVFQEMESSERIFIEKQCKCFLNFIGRAFSDLAYISSEFDAGREDTLEAWKVILESSGLYNKIRYIDLNGQEDIRLDYLSGNTYTISTEHFQNVKDEAYFAKTMELDEGQFFISKINEITSANYPDQLSVMFCTPVYSEGLDGILVLDLNAKNMLDNFKNSLMSDIGSDEVYLINDYGYWVLSENDYKGIDVQYYDIAYNIGILPPEEWETLKDKPNNINENGLYTYKEIDYSGSFAANGKRDKSDVLFQETHCKIVTLIKSGAQYDYYFYNDFMKKVSRIISQWLVFIILCFLVAVLGALFLSLNKSKLERIQDSSSFDSLTKTYNRRQGFVELQKRISGISYYKSICLCYVDINGLKEVNDTLGHCAGDELIITVSDTIKNTIREQDLVIRMGGDEFLIVLMKVEKAIAEIIWVRITEAFKAINSMEDRNYVISASHGIVQIKNSDEKADISMIITQADDKMYEEKVRVKKTLNVIRKKF